MMSHVRNVKLLAWSDMLTPECIVCHPALLSSQGRDRMQDQVLLTVGIEAL